jgi:hypothetical protein
VVRQGEKDRVVSVRLPRADFASAPSTSSTSEYVSSTAHTAPKTRLKVPLGAWISYGVGVAALGTWGTFAVLGRHEEKGLVECSPNCQATRRDDYDSMKRDYLIADVSLAVAAGAAIAGTITLLTMGRKPETGAERGASVSAQRKVSVSPAVLGRAGALLTLQARY